MSSTEEDVKKPEFFEILERASTMSLLAVWNRDIPDPDLPGPDAPEIRVTITGICTRQTREDDEVLRLYDPRSIQVCDVDGSVEATPVSPWVEVVAKLKKELEGRLQTLDFVPRSSEDDKGLSILKELVQDINQTGGIHEDENGNITGCGGDPEWVDLAVTYAHACAFLGVPPLISKTDEEEEEEDPEASFSGFRCNDCGAEGPEPGIAMTDTDLSFGQVGVCTECRSEDIDIGTFGLDENDLCECGREKNTAHDGRGIPRTVDGIVGCQMECISKEGLCGRKATHVWIQKDGSELRVCARCLPCVMVNGCDVREITPNNSITGG